VGLLGGGGGERVGLRTGAGSGGRAVRYGGDVVGSMKEKEEGALGGMERGLLMKGKCMNHVKKVERTVVESDGRWGNG